MAKRKEGQVQKVCYEMQEKRETDVGGKVA